MKRGNFLLVIGGIGALFLCGNVWCEEQEKENFIDFDEVHVRCSGEVVVEQFSSKNLATLNERLGIDVADYVRSTFDYSFFMKYGEVRYPALDGCVTLRFRYLWGAASETVYDDLSVKLFKSTTVIGGKNVNKHLLWMRESWVKVALNKDSQRDPHIFQIGLIPFEVGRGISLGAAYDRSEVLGVTPGFSIEQYAPAVLYHGKFGENNFVQCYGALTQNKNSSLDENVEKIREQQLDVACPMRGTGCSSFIVALRGQVHGQFTHAGSINFEPYVVHHSAPDKSFQFKNDISLQMSTFGVGIETSVDRFNWGIEGAVNCGEVVIKPWDMNAITTIATDDGTVREQYSKIYDQDPTLSTAKLVDVTLQNFTLVQADRDSNKNCQQIAPGLFNACDRFRPRQYVDLQGYFLIADATYECKPNVLRWDIGAGYFSGYAKHSQSIKNSNLRQKFTGFIPLQSEYYGKRIRHFVMFNQGIPRHAVAKKTDSQGLIHTELLGLDAINAISNIAFFGTRAAWTFLVDDHKILWAPNLIVYWAAQTACLDQNGGHISPRNYLGTELNFEFNVALVKNLELDGYAGMFIPGSFYHDMRGFVVRDFDVALGDNVALLANIALSYKF